METYARPANRFVAGFLGLTNFLAAWRARRRRRRTVRVRVGEIELAAGMPMLDCAPVPPSSWPCGPSGCGCRAGDASDARFEARVTEVVFEGDRSSTRCGRRRWAMPLLRLFDLDPLGHARHAPGDVVTIGWLRAMAGVFCLTARSNGGNPE